MDFNFSRKLKFDLNRVIHIGAHKFEEASHYEDYGTKNVFWVDPFPQIDPISLPANQEFLCIAIDDVNAKTFRDFRIYEATGFSSFFELDSPGSIIRGTPNNSRTVRVEVNSLRNVQSEYDLDGFETIVIDTQGSEFEILKSANLGKVQEVVVETSRIPLYSSETTHSEIHQFLQSEGFHHNLNNSDYIYGHGDQYYSRTSRRHHLLEICCRLRETIQFICSFLARVKIGVGRRVTTFFTKLNRRKK
jgi:FkbM family methyltransferase